MLLFTSRTGSRDSYYCYIDCRAAVCVCVRTSSSPLLLLSLLFTSSLPPPLWGPPPQRCLLTRCVNAYIPRNRKDEGTSCTTSHRHHRTESTFTCDLSQVQRSCDLFTRHESSSRTSMSQRQVKSSLVTEADPGSPTLRGERV